MKRLLMIFAAVILTAGARAQSPEKMSYQSVVRDAKGDLVVNTQIGMQISILRSLSPLKTAYVETQTPMTNENGLVTIEVGSGTVVSGDFSTINWSIGTKYIRTEIDPAGEANYTITGTSQLLSVPYALYAKTAENVSWDTIGNKIYYDGGNVGIGTSDPLADLHIKNSSGGTSLNLESEDDTRIYLTSNRSGVDDYWMGIDGGNNKFILANTTNSRYLLVGSGDNVGINTLTPSSVLHVKGGYNVDALTLQTGSTYGTGWTGIHFTSGLNNSGIAAFRSYSDGSLNGDLRFYTDNNGTSIENLVERVRISSNGYLGIGTTAPKAPLHINDFMKLEPRSSAPSNPEEGMVYYNSGDHKLYVYDGTNWTALN